MSAATKGTRMKRGKTVKNKNIAFQQAVFAVCVFAHPPSLLCFADETWPGNSLPETSCLFQCSSEVFDYKSHHSYSGSWSIHLKAAKFENHCSVKGSETQI